MNLTIPKLLAAKFGRQIISVTLIANVPVLGDADYVIQMVNGPLKEGRECVIGVCGCFESRAVTEALVELEGGERAFQFRQHRYSLALAASTAPPTPMAAPHFSKTQARKSELHRR